MTVDLAVELASQYGGGLLLQNPVMTASGTFGYGTEYADLVDITQLGAIVSPSITLRPRRGHPQPRLVDAPGGLLSANGLQNIGLRAVIEHKAPIWATWQVPVIVSVAGHTGEEYADVAAGLEGVPGIAGLELNIAPHFGNFPPLVDGATAASVTRAVRTATTLPILVKLRLDAGDIASVVQAVEQAGADALTLCNTATGIAIDVRYRRPALASIFGGLSGPALKPLALSAVYQAARLVSIPIIGCGGITCPEDALEFLMAGACAVQIGTAVMADPATPARIVAGIAAFLERSGEPDLRQLIGSANRDRPR